MQLGLPEPYVTTEHERTYARVVRDPVVSEVALLLGLGPLSLELALFLPASQGRFELEAFYNFSRERVFLRSWVETPISRAVLTFEWWRKD